MVEFDKDKYKIDSKKSWNKSAQAWSRWWHVIEEGAQPVTKKMLDLAKVREGHRILDIGTGVGEPALTAALRVGPKGYVLGIDQASQMILFAKRRVEQLQLSQLEFREVDAEELSGLEEDFDAVLSRWGMMFIPDCKATFEHIFRMLKPGGHLALSVWAEPENTPTISLPYEVLKSYVTLPEISHELPGAFRFSNPEHLVNILKSIGFESIETEFVNVRFDYPSPEAFLEFRKGVATSNQYLNKLSVDKEARYWQALKAKVKTHVSDEGRVNMDNTAICVIAKKPIQQK